jgi:hypothetical protein
VERGWYFGLENDRQQYESTATTLGHMDNMKKDALLCPSCTVLRGIGFPGGDLQTEPSLLEYVESHYLFVCCYFPLTWSKPKYKTLGLSSVQVYATKKTDFETIPACLGEADKVV